MKKIIAQFFSIVFILFLPFLDGRPVSAHGGDERIEVSPDQLNPGSVLDVRGVLFEPEVEVALFLVGLQGEIPLGNVMADAEGIFLLTVTLPVDLTQGAYVVRGITDDHTIDSPQLAIWGTADPGEGEGGPIDEDDTLLAPFPTIGPGEPTPMMASAASTEGTLNQESTVQAESFALPSVWIAVAAGVGIVVSVLVLALKKR